MRVIVVKENETKIVGDFESSLKNFYETIGCECIDIVNISIGDEERRYDIICDDEAL